MHRPANVLALAGILLVGGLLLTTGIVRIRDGTNRATCANNLRELGIAVHNHNGTWGALPGATVSMFQGAEKASKYLPPERRLSWLVETIQFREQLGLLLDGSKAWDEDPNRVPQGCGVDGEVVWVLGELAYYHCPGNPGRAIPDGACLTHYVGIAGLGKDAISSPVGYLDEGYINPTIGIIGYGQRLRPADIKDGTANTLLAVETRLNNGPWTASGYPTARGLDSAGLPYLGRDGQFGGTHRGGLNVLFADGSVRFLTEETSPQVLEAMATVAGGD